MDDLTHRVEEVRDQALELMQLGGDCRRSTEPDLISLNQKWEHVCKGIKVQRIWKFSNLSISNLVCQVIRPSLPNSVFFLLLIAYFNISIHKNVCPLQIKHSGNFVIFYFWDLASFTKECMMLKYQNVIILIIQKLFCGEMLFWISVTVHWIVDNMPVGSKLYKFPFLLNWKL